MKSRSLLHFEPLPMLKQRGVALFFSLIALVVMSLAAVALIRSVDTSTMIAGNLAFKQSATASSDAGIDNAAVWLLGVETANSAMNVLSDIGHPFNITNAAQGYYSYTDPSKSLTDGTGFQWNATDSVLVGTDGSGNTLRYIIQRMCRNNNQPIQSADCLFSGEVQDKNSQSVPLPQSICKGSGCPSAGQTPQIRITVRSEGPKNTLSYVQAFIY